MSDVPANKTPVSVDYTGRDYYALRTELIARVREATNQQWQGNDPADFGLALIEAFAYMGDQINYYIDRIANESYLLTATQRQSLLNIAQVYGYTPTGFVGSTVEATFTSKIGSENQIGGSQLTTIDVPDSGGSPVSTPHVAELIVPNNHPFAVDDWVIVSGMDETQYNGTYQIIKVGLDAGLNVICYKPESSISHISGNGTVFTVTTSANHQFKPGESVVISGVSPSGYNGTWTVGEVLGATSFTVTSSVSTSYVSGGKVNYANVATNGTGTDVLGYAYQVGTVTIPQGTQLTAEVTYADKTQQVAFTTLADVEVGHIGNPYNSRPVSARQGENVAYRDKNKKNLVANAHDIDGELLGYSNGQAEQSLSLSETQVDKALLDVYVDDGINFNKWQQVQHLTDYGPSSAVYTVSLAADNSVTVNFGDGVSGAIPPQDAAIKAVYYVGGGPIGNIAAGQLTTITAVPTTTTEEETIIKGFVTVTNESVGAGGADPETNDVIRFNAPRALSALNRAVTLDDFANLALSYRGVGKARATSEARTSVTVYIAPTQADSSTEVTPGLTDGVETTAMTILRQNVAEFLSDKKQIGTTVTVAAPTYTQVELTVEYSTLPQYNAAQVEQYIKSALFSQFAYNYVDFADVITPEEIEFKLRQVTGIRNIRVKELHRAGGSGRISMVGSEKELFVFVEANLTLVSAPTDATLSALTSGTNTTWNTDFNASITDYFIAVDSGTSSIPLVATLNDSTHALLTVNDAVVASASTQTISTPVGNTVVVVSVTAGDGVTVRNYRLTFSRIS